MTEAKLREMLQVQLAIDYNCYAEDFQKPNTLITSRTNNAERRLFEEESIASLLVHEGKLIVSVEDEFFDAAEEFFEAVEGEWSFDTAELIAFDRVLGSFGYELGPARIGFVPTEERKTPSAESVLGEVRLLEGAALEEFRGDERFNEALLFSPVTPDMLAIAAYNGRGTILGMAGASRNSASMWEIGVNVAPEFRRQGIAAGLIGLLADEVLKRGSLPYFNACISHLAAQRTALAAGLRPAFCEARSFPVHNESPFED